MNSEAEHYEKKQHGNTSHAALAMSGDVWRCLALACCFPALVWRFDVQFLQE